MDGNKCDECGETEFTAREGYYYCDECGTQSRYVRDIAIEQTGFDDPTFFTTIKVKKTKTEKEQLTTWECFNYLLCGLVDELQSFGAKEELKLTVLQLWTTYLQKTEVAFFSERQPQLPRLGPKYAQRDAKILYNHLIQRKIQARKETTKVKEETWLQKRRRLAKADYEIQSTSQSEKSKSTSAPSTSQNSSSSASTNRAIRLHFSRKARKYYKRVMPAKHLRKHEDDSMGTLTCHTLHSRQFSGPKVRSEVLSRKTIYSLLYLGLNLIEDDIQLCDFIRFTREGHIASSKVSHLFPENIAKDCEKVITMNTHFGWNLFRNNAIRKEAAVLARFINVKSLKTPDLMKIARRFVNDLNLPLQVATFIERLFNFFPSVMKHCLENSMTPCYEGRAMAYVIFTLKLLFTLDGETERIISDSARTINSKLIELGEEDKKLFVWEDWVKFIEMRKVIITQCHYPTSVHLDENVNSDQYIEHLKEAYQISSEDIPIRHRNKLLNMEKIFDDLHSKLCKKNQKEKLTSLKCPPSFTPYRSYLQYILGDNKLSEKICIPPFVRDDPSAWDINSYVDTKNLKKIFAKHRIRLNIKKLNCHENRNIIGVFKSNKFYKHLRLAGAVKVREVDFEIEESEWIDQVRSAPKDPDLVTKDNKFKMPVKSKDFLRSLLLSKRPEMMTIPADNASVRSFDIFSEENMEPLNDNADANQPRRFYAESILTDVEDDEENEPFDNVLTLNLSNFDCWNFLGINQYFKVDEVAKIETKLPKIFRWLLKICADIAELQVIDLYQELLAIESHFIYALESFDDFTDFLSYRIRNEDKDVNRAVRFYKNMW